jgi:chemotaxis protein methyltransferase CheR
MALVSVELKDRQFKKISRIVYDYSGINLKSGKESLVKARLAKRLRNKGMTSVEEYIRHIESAEGANELVVMLDIMTTNKTSYFREVEHFKYMEKEILPRLKSNRMRFWSAACSSGEEPYSIAISLMENLRRIESKDVLILATDISSRMLEKVKGAVYSEENISDLPKAFLHKYFVKVQKNPSVFYKVKDNVRSIVRVAWLNLMEQWPMKGTFNVIFCRNVMIYFDRPTQEKLINRFYDYLEPGGYLFVGHSEGLSGVKHKFNYVKPATYRK